MENEKEIFLIPTLEALYKLHAELEIDSTASFAIMNAMVDMVKSFHQCSGINGRSIVKAVIECSITLPGDVTVLMKTRFYLSARLNEDWFQENNGGAAWPLVQNVKLRPDEPPAPKKQLIATASTPTQTELSMAEIDNITLASDPRLRLRWVFD